MKKYSCKFSLLNQIKVSLFIEPVKDQIEQANKLGADIVELHTGLFCGLSGKHYALSRQN